MSFYQIKLTPIDAYFFGGEKHSKNMKNSSGFEMDYFVQSELYPQQTTLLGVLRYYLLLQKGLLNPHKNEKTNEANELIGKESFSYGYNEDVVQNFEKIKKVSPLYFHKHDFYFKNKSQKYIIAPFGNEFLLTREYGNFKLDGYDAKKGYQRALMNIQDNSTMKFFKDPDNKDDEEFIFIPHDIVGNKKGDKGKAEDDGFYKQTLYKLNKGWSFIFEAEINCDMKDDWQFLTFGAEKQLFSFEISPIEEFTELALKLAEKLLPAIFCISDSFVAETIWEHTAFAVNENASFRNLQSSNNSKNYSSFSSGYKRSKRYNLLKRGSVLFFETDDKRNAAKRLFKNTNAENIGFNTIQLI